MSYRVIALDLDGTLLDPQKQILPQSLAAINQARRQGIKVIIATGRHHVAIHPFYQALNLDTPAICCNGTYLYDYHAKKVLESDPLSAAEATKVVAYLQGTDINHLMYVDDAMLYQQHNDAIERTLKWADSLPENQRPNIHKIDNFNTAIQQVTAIWKFATCTPDIEKLRTFSQTIQQELELACEWSWFDQVDIAKKGNSKGLRLQRWVESQGLTMKDVIAFGDNFNDVSMLTAAGLGVAMGNSCDEVKKHADIITDQNSAPGIAQVIEKYVL
ncbi:pyridoxal phosphatase [Arsenophonus sp.]|uniref:pyridoxal phosphatase n=1 Tax=Arsenophonus sp. TaxID=1872640 RepID=UPI0028634F76|nr:pyridoxal phosphatase [Arsenophonus sp.]MDR5615839.1 pyridoxal phosphatase [Arsenophonus sp.]